MTWHMGWNANVCSSPVKHFCGSGAKEWRLPGEKGAGQSSGRWVGSACHGVHCHSEPEVYPVGNRKSSFTWFLTREITWSVSIL